MEVRPHVRKEPGSDTSLCTRLSFTCVMGTGVRYIS